MLGDVALFGRFSVERSDKVEQYFCKVAEYLSAFDHVVGNLETPLVSGVPPVGPKSAHISSHPNNARVLKFLGVDIVNLANNHIYDFGEAGYRSTVRSLEDAGIAYFGVEDRQLELRGTSASVALHGYCSYNTNPLGAAPVGYRVNPLNVLHVQKRIAENHSNGLFNIVSIHSGEEHINYPSRDDVNMARSWAELCPYVYYGHHPHVIQGVERRRGSLIAYSLGNFCFDDVYTDRSAAPLIRQTDNNKTGLILELTLGTAGLTDCKLTPVYAGHSEMAIDLEEVSQTIAAYSDALTREEPEYSLARAQQLASVLAERRVSRDVDWFLARLNLQSAMLLLRARYNAYQYNRHVKRHLSDTPSAEPFVAEV